MTANTFSSLFNEWSASEIQELCLNRNLSILSIGVGGWVGGYVGVSHLYGIDQIVSILLEAEDLSREVH